MTEETDIKKLKGKFKTLINLSSDFVFVHDDGALHFPSRQGLMATAAM